MAIEHACPQCQHVRHLPEINDDPMVGPKLKLDEIVQFVGREGIYFKIVSLHEMRATLEKV